MSWAPKQQRLYFAHGQRIMTWDSTTNRTVETFEVKDQPTVPFTMLPAAIFVCSS